MATLFASLLGYNPIQQLLGPAAAHNLSAQHLHFLTGRQFFPNLISAPFHNGLQVAFIFAIVACLVAAWASWLRGGKYHYEDEPEDAEDAVSTERFTGLGSLELVEPLSEPENSPPPEGDGGRQHLTPP